MVFSEATFGKHLGTDYSSEQRHVEDESSDYAIHDRRTIEGLAQALAALPQVEPQVEIYRRDENFTPRTLEALVQRFKETGLFEFISRVIGSGALNEQDEVTVQTFEVLEQNVDDNTPAGVKNQLKLLRKTYQVA